MEKLKNPYFWLSLIALIFTAAGIEFEQLTSWWLLFQAILDIAQIPGSIVAIITAFLGIWNDNSTSGLDTFKIRKTNKEN